MNIQLLRHATLVLTFAGRTLMVDPMLSPTGAMDPVANAANTQRIPLVKLPLSDEALRALIRRVDAVLVTHTHRDHWDARAIELLPKDVPLIGQPEDEARFRQDGFTHIMPVKDALDWGGIHLVRTHGQHGTGEIGQKMGTVSGFVLTAPGEPSLYIAGDTIWCADVETALSQHKPDVTVVNAGAAQFLTGDPITMTAADVAQVCRFAPKTQVVAVHMEAINHCWLRRSMLAEQLEAAGFPDRVVIPADGDLLSVGIAG